MRSTLDWYKISEKTFEEICREVGETTFPSVRPSRYLKNGHAQDGIDILSAAGEDGKYICMQCKHVEVLSQRDLTEIVDLLLAKQFHNKTSCFVLATTTDLQEPKLQRHLIALTEQLLERNIRFEYWDRRVLEEKLKRQYSVVSYYFGTAAADEHCYAQSRLPGIPPRTAEKDYLQRTLSLMENGLEEDSLPSFFFDKEAIKLASLFTGEYRFQRRMIGVIANAHEGKSVELRQNAYLLEHVSIPFTCLLIELKSQLTIPIDQLLDTHYRGWKHVPAKDLAVFIDGLDEVPTESFEDTLLHIRDFSLKNPYVSIIFSCRKLFFNQYRVKERLGAFSFYRLGSIQYEDIRIFIRSQLNRRYEKFMDFVRKASIGFLLSEPFYLVSLIKLFKESPGDLPRTKIAIIEKLMLDSFSVNDHRRLSGGRLLHQRAVDATRMIQQFAFALQLHGSNSMEARGVQQLFSLPEIELLEHSSLITIENDRWSFVNAIFQEHIAAVVLSKMSFEDIVAIVTVGTYRRKIKAKWIQTVTSLLFLLEEGAMRDLVLQLMKDDNIELLFYTEHSKFDAATKLEVLKSLFERLEQYQLRPILIDDSAIALFIQGIPVAVDFLTALVDGAGTFVGVKTTCLGVLKFVTLSPAEKTRLSSTLQKELLYTTDPGYAGELMQVLAKHQLGDESLVRALIGNVTMGEYHAFRDGVYQLIVTHELADKCFPYVIDGIRALRKYNTAIRHGGSEMSFEKAITQIKSLGNMRRLFDAFMEPDWMAFYKYSHDIRELWAKVLDNMRQLHEGNASIAFILTGFVKKLGLKHLRGKYDGLEAFLSGLTFNTLPARILMEDILSKTHWGLSVFVTEEVFDYLLFEFEECDLQVSVLYSIVNALDNNGKIETAAKLRQLIKDAYVDSTQDIAFEEVVWTTWQRAKDENDRKYISDRHCCLEGVKKYFEAYGHSSIPMLDIYVDYTSERKRQLADSDFIERLLHRKLKRDGKVYLSDTIKFLAEEEQFLRFRAEFILDLKINDSERSFYEGLVSPYYNDNIQSAEFENCVSMEDERGVVSLFSGWKENLMVRLYETFLFETPADKLMMMVWADQSGIKGLEDNNNQPSSPTKLILTRLTERQIADFAELVLKNIRKGIKCRLVLATHLGICKYLKVYEAREDLWSLLSSGDWHGMALQHVTEVFLSLGGTLYEMLTVLKALDRYNWDFLYLSELLAGEYPHEVEPILIGCLREPLVDESIVFNTAKVLTQIGSEEGFVYLVDLLRKNGMDSGLTQGNVNIAAIDTTFALSVLDDLAGWMMNTGNDEGPFWKSPRTIMVEWTYQLAEKSEADLDLVVQWLFGKQQIFRDAPQHHHFFFYAFNAIEAFRKVKEPVKPVREVAAAVRRWVTR